MDNVIYIFLFSIQLKRYIKPLNIIYHTIPEKCHDGLDKGQDECYYSSHWMRIIPENTLDHLFISKYKNESIRSNSILLSTPVSVSSLANINYRILST